MRAINDYLLSCYKNLSTCLCMNSFKGDIMKNGPFLSIFVLVALCFGSEAADKMLHNRLYQVRRKIHKSDETFTTSFILNRKL